MAFIDSLDEGQDKDMIKCPKCDKQFNNVSTLAVHMKSHKVDPQMKSGDLFVCQKCGKTAKTRQALERHAAYHQDDRPFACENCEQRFKNSDDRGKHYRRLKKDGKFAFACTTCHKHFKSDLLLMKHQVMLGCLNAQSDIVDKTETVNGGIDDMQEDKVPLDVPETPLGLGIKPIPCRCKICEMDFKSPELLKVHYKLHHSELKRQVCIQCGQTLSSKDSLNRHYNIFHQEDFSYPCIQCDQKFKIKESMFRHVKFVHTDGGYPCLVCKHVFSQPVNLKKHMSVHSPEKKHVCMICNKGFKLKQSLRKHLIVHTNRRFKYEEVDISDTEEEEMPEQLENAHELESSSPQKTFRNGNIGENRTLAPGKGGKSTKHSDSVRHPKVHVTDSPRKVVDSRDTFVERDEHVGKSEVQPVAPELVKSVNDSVSAVSNDADDDDETCVHIIHDDIELSEVETIAPEVITLGDDTTSDLSNSAIKNKETCVEVIQNAHSMNETNIDMSNILKTELETGTVPGDDTKTFFYPNNRKVKEKRDQETGEQIATSNDYGDPANIGMSEEAMIENWSTDEDTSSEAMQSDFSTPEEPESGYSYGKKLTDLDSNIKHTSDSNSYTQVLPNSKEDDLVEGISSMKEKRNVNLDRFQAERCIDLVINLAEKHTDSEARRLADLYQDTESEGPTVVKKNRIDGTVENLSKCLAKVPEKTERSNWRHLFKPSYLPLIMAPSSTSNAQRRSVSDKNCQRSVKNPFIIQNTCRRTTSDGFCQCQKCAPYDQEEATAMNLCVTDNRKQMSKMAPCDIAPGKFSLIKHMLSLQNEEHFDKTLFDNPLYNKPAQIHSFPKLAAMHKISNGSDMDQYDLSGKQNIPLHWLCLRRTSNITESVQIIGGSGKIPRNSCNSKSVESNSFCNPAEPTVKLNERKDRNTRSFVDKERCGDNGIEISHNIMDIVERDTHISGTIAQINKAVNDAGINVKHDLISDSSHALWSPSKDSSAIIDDNWEQPSSGNPLASWFNSQTWNENPISKTVDRRAGYDDHKTSVDNLSSGSVTLTHSRSRPLSSVTHVGEGQMDRWHPYKAMKTLRAHGNMNKGGFDGLDSPSVLLNPLDMSQAKSSSLHQQSTAGSFSRSSSLTEQPGIEGSYNNQDLGTPFGHSINVPTSSSVQTMGLSSNNVITSAAVSSAQSDGLNSQQWLDSANSGSFSNNLHLNDSSLTSHNQPIFTATPVILSSEMQPIHHGRNEAANPACLSNTRGLSVRKDRDDFSACSKDKRGLSHGTLSSQNIVYTSPDTCSNSQMISSDTHINETVLSVDYNCCVFQSSHESHLCQSVTRNSDTLQSNHQRHLNDFRVKISESLFSDQPRRHNIMSSNENDAVSSSPNEFVGKLSQVGNIQARQSQYTLANMANNQGKSIGSPFQNRDPLNPINLIKQGNSPLKLTSDIDDRNFTKFKERTASRAMRGNAVGDTLPTREITLPTRGLIRDRKEGLSVVDVLLMSPGSA